MRFGKILKAVPRIAAWALASLGRLLRKGTRAAAYTQSAAAQNATVKHKHFSQPFLDWFEEAVELSPQTIVEKQGLYDRLWRLQAGTVTRNMEQRAFSGG